MDRLHKCLVKVKVYLFACMYVRMYVCTYVLHVLCVLHVLPVRMYHLCTVCIACTGTVGTVCIVRTLGTGGTVCGLFVFFKHPCGVCVCVKK